MDRSMHSRRERIIETTRSAAATRKAGADMAGVTGDVILLSALSIYDNTNPLEQNSQSTVVVIDRVEPFHTEGAKSDIT